MDYFVTLRVQADDVNEADEIACGISDYAEAPLVEVSSRFVSTTTNEALLDAEAERIALADAWRAQMEGEGVPKVTAALIVQEIIDNAKRVHTS